MAYVGQADMREFLPKGYTAKEAMVANIYQYDDGFTVEAWDFSPKISYFSTDKYEALEALAQGVAEEFDVLQPNLSEFSGLPVVEKFITVGFQKTL